MHKAGCSTMSMNGGPSHTPDVPNGSSSSSTTADYPRRQSWAANGIRVKSSIPKKRHEVLRWDGWGYKSSKFYIKDDIIGFNGDSARYPIANVELPMLTEEVLNLFKIDLKKRPVANPHPINVPKSIISKDVLEEIGSLGMSASVEDIDRVVRSHGQTIHDIVTLKSNKYSRIPDAVVWPTCHEEVVKLVELAQKRDLVIIPIGGGTSVSRALECPPEEKRPILSLDTTQMNSILWVDEESMVVCCEGGIVGQDLERELKSLGYTTGHEPDSYEFSSLGGWVATRASGMKKNTYGNIEDLLVHVRMVTPSGVLERGCRGPRISCGPDFHHTVLGSEGNLGVITEVILKIRPAPRYTRYGSIVFPDFRSGFECLREVARQRLQPSSIRLMDNNQFRFGQSMRPAPSYFEAFKDYVKKAYITKIKGFDYDKMCVTTLLFEGDDEEEMANHERRINDIAGQHCGVVAGARNGERGYVLTFVIAYMRDFAYEYDVIGESFETSVPWDKAMSLCRNVNHRIGTECRKLKIEQFQVSWRLTQTYDAGCCIYFYFGFQTVGVENPLDTYDVIEEKARDEIISSGGSISHHHGIGKLRKKWYKETVSEAGVSILQATKKALDPKNVFAINNFTEEIASKS